MPSYKEALSALDQYYDRIIRLKEDLQKHMNSNLPKPQKDEIQGLIEKQMEALERYKRNLLEELVTYPPHMEKHFQKLPDFQTAGAYDKSVFIMTKYPDNENPQQRDLELKRVINALQSAIANKGLIPRLAIERRFHPGLWDNVELYLLGCKYGVAVLENRYLDELNPNVAMEWGWMRGMDKNVLYLVENTFDLDRADLSGLIQDRFAWDNPEPDINRAINGWL